MEDMNVKASDTGSQNNYAESQETVTANRALEKSGAEIGSGNGRDFASLLESVTQTREREPRDANDQSRQEQFQGRDAANVRQAETRTRPKSDDDSEQENSVSGEAGQVSTNRINLPDGLNELHAVLPAPDLNNIMVAVRTQLLPGGLQEVMLELPNSVLAGLRIRLTATISGRIAADFTTNSEQTKAVLDARSAELSDLLRARGVNLISLKTTLDTSTGNHDDFAGQRQAAHAELVRAEAKDSRSGAAPDADDHPVADRTQTNRRDLWRT